MDDEHTVDSLCNCITIAANRICESFERRPRMDGKLMLTLVLVGASIVAAFVTNQVTMRMHVTAPEIHETHEQKERAMASFFEPRLEVVMAEIRAIRTEVNTVDKKVDRLLNGTH